MIGYIKGKVIGKSESHILLENNGIGYKVFVTPKIASIAVNSEVALYTYLQVREDAHTLFGFSTAEELNFFEQLITVSGVGPKMALSILSAENMDLVKQAIVDQDVAVFTKVGGIGKKTAEKIIVELKEKLGSTGSIEQLGKSDDFIKALENLGYSNSEIKAVIGKIDHSAAVEEKLRQALKLLGR